VLITMRLAEAGVAQPHNQLARPHGDRAEPHGFGAHRLRHVVVVALEPFAAQLQPVGEGVQLGVAAVTDQVRPAPAAPAPDGPVDEDRHYSAP
jgi:hypothetical protein